MSGGIVLVGAGGHAKVILGLLRAAGRAVEACYDDVEAKWGQALLGAPIRGPIAALRGTGRAALIAIGDNRARQRWSRDLDLDWTTAVHPFAFVDPSASVGPGAVVFAGAVVQPDATIGAHAIVNTGATVDHDCTVGAWVHLAPGSHLAGNVRVDEGAFVGIGAVTIPGRTIGAWSTVGAGSVVVRDIPARVTALGTPARPKER